MNEPKRRGRPPKAVLLSGQGIEGGDVREVVALPVLVTVQAAPAVSEITRSTQAAQAYAMRVWAGQSVNIKRAERIARIQRALEGQSLPIDGVQYPGSDDDVWTEADELPVTWRMKAGA